jgi:hypothetical protein
MGAGASSVMTWASGTGILRVTGTNAMADGGLIAVVGTSNTSWGGIPLPFLIPGSDAAPSGPCNLYNDVLLLKGNVATPTGTSTTDFAVPATPDLHGLVTRSQIWGLDATANPIGIVTSNMVIHQWIAPFAVQPASRMFLSGLGAIGSLGPGSGNVVQFN